MKARRNYFQEKRKVILGLMTLLIFAVAEGSLAKDIYVSVDGGAQADGSLAKPYGSLPDAVEAVRALRKAGDTEPAVIRLRGGRYQLNQTLVLGRKDGVSAEVEKTDLDEYGAGPVSGPARLTIAAYPGETPVLSAGVPVTGWSLPKATPPGLPAIAAGKVWVADMPEGLERFYTLYDDRGRLNRARDAGFLPTKNGTATTLHFPEGRLKNWDNIEDVEIQVRAGRAYTIVMVPLESVDEENSVASTAVSTRGRMTKLERWVHGADASVWVENILEALDEPGEWVVDTKKRKIYLWPSDPDSDGSPRGILAPRLTELVRVEGLIDVDGPKDIPVRGIEFSGLTFTHGDRWAWTNAEGRLGRGLQHDWEMYDRSTAMLRFRGAEDCRTINCNFVNAGSTGVRFDLHAQRNRVVDCEFGHLGEAGILMVGYAPGDKDVNHHNDIMNNHIHHFSEISWSSPGFWAWQSGHNHIAHNYIHHSGYSAVLISTRAGRGGRNGQEAGLVDDMTTTPKHNAQTPASWLRKSRYIHTRHNLLEYNEITDCVQLLSDGNGIYVSGAGVGNIVRYNYLHDSLKHSLPAAIRCDDDQHDTLIYGNVLYNNYGFSAGIVCKGVNDVINNFIVAPAGVPRGGYITFAWIPAKGARIQRNIIMSHPEGGKAFGVKIRKGTPEGKGPRVEETDMDANLYYHATDSSWMDEHLLKMQALGKEKTSLVGDPLFVDAEGGDFSFRPGSPALALGIEPLDVSKMGLLEDPSSLIND
ncbi:right-handed parallel beta-helix repeat-containing protein [Planctomycetota bacterium]